MNFYVYSPEALLEQAGSTSLEQGYYHLRFYVDSHGQLSKVPTDKLASFYYSPSGGTLRDAELNIVVYSARFDKFKGIGKAE